MALESTGNERGTPRLFELIENSPKTGDSPTIWAWPQITEFLKVASQPARPNPDADSMPVAVKDNKSK